MNIHRDILHYKYGHISDTYASNCLSNDVQRGIRASNMAISEGTRQIMSRYVCVVWSRHTDICNVKYLPGNESKR